MRSGNLEVDRAGAAATVFLKLVLNALVTIERAQAGGLDCTDVDERIAGSVFRLNEAIAFFRVEKFDDTGWHSLGPSCWANRGGAPDASGSERRIAEPQSTETDNLRL